LHHFNFQNNAVKPTSPTRQRFPTIERTAIGRFRGANLPELHILAQSLRRTKNANQSQGAQVSHDKKAETSDARI
jgi:hypothetical protein